MVTPRLCLGSVVEDKPSELHGEMCASLAVGVRVVNVIHSDYITWSEQTGYLYYS